MNFKYFIVIITALVLMNGFLVLSYERVIKEAVNKETTAINNDYKNKIYAKKGASVTAESINKISTDTLTRKEKRKLEKEIKRLNK